MTRIAAITKAIARHYSDNQTDRIYVEWVDTRGERGATGGVETNTHMQALLMRAQREGIFIEQQIW